MTQTADFHVYSRLLFQAGFQPPGVPLVHFSACDLTSALAWC